MRGLADASQIQTVNPKTLRKQQKVSLIQATGDHLKSEN